MSYLKLVMVLIEEWMVAAAGLAKWTLISWESVASELCVWVKVGGGVQCLT